LRLLTMSVLVALLCACASHKIKPQLSEKEYYDGAQKSLTAGNFAKATENLESLESYYPVGLYTEQAQLEVIYAKFRHVDYAGASAAADRFIRLHPTHPQVDYAYYLRGLSDYEADRDFFTRYLPVNSAWRDLTNVRDSFNNFRELVTRFPNSEYTPDARARMIFVRNQMAEAELHRAKFYARKKAYLSCLNRTRWIIENYPGTPQTQDALALQVWAYNKLGIKDLSEQELALLKTNYPGYKGIDKLNAEISGNESRSWLNIATFGLLGSNNTQL
jgi:outer membrane protein assembly factor BamD